MGFGSYDESEQQNQEVSADDDDSDGVSIHEHEHEGQITFETDASTDDLMDQLAEIKDNDEDE
ncbi:DUF5786 family protein [Halalkalicoccus salilacus]|uniref:DUF5786 family protein n=1 Tax=Halalkalicoccus TaxID=332246 RepID=UPI002F96215D